MKESMWGYLILALGVSIIAILLLVQNLTTTSEENFYLAREVLESSMYDAVDYGTYAKSGKLVMSEQKFVEVFLRRFSESVTNNKTYQINFYDIHEYPPKATVLITTNSGETTVSSDSFNVNINTYLNAVLETVSNYEEEYVISKLTDTYKMNEGDEYLTLKPLEMKSQNLSCGTKVKMNFKFLADNDPCGLYIAACDDKLCFTRSKKEGINYVNKVNEYCEVVDDKGIGYYVSKSSLAKPDEYSQISNTDYVKKWCQIKN